MIFMLIRDKDVYADKEPRPIKCNILGLHKVPLPVTLGTCPPAIHLVVVVREASFNIINNITNINNINNINNTICSTQYP
jgi:hypothetical protein